MQQQIKQKLNLIGDIWNNYIIDNKFCHNQINFDIEASSNYFGEILGYFVDTFDIIFDKKNSSNDSENFASHISFLQALYVQQDFVWEMLILFQTNIPKRNLRLDSNYTINRDIRNELVGHPISRNRDGTISSTVFGYQRFPDQITYLRYRSENNFEAEIIKLQVEDIVKRHVLFLNKYFDIIIESLKAVLENYAHQLTELEVCIDQVSFPELVEIIDTNLEYFLKNTFLYDKQSILAVYAKKDDHRRYLLVYESFIKDLREQISEMKKGCSTIFNPEAASCDDAEIPLFDDDMNFIEIPSKNKPAIPKEDYHYELGKLSTKRNPSDFEFFSGLLKSKCDNKTVLAELDRMEKILDNDIEYLCSYKLISVILKNE